MCVDGAQLTPTRIKVERGAIWARQARRRPGRGLMVTRGASLASILTEERLEALSGALLARRQPSHGLVATRGLEAC
eukprot:175913-Prymnesium_polylepis.1